MTRRPPTGGRPPPSGRWRLGALVLCVAVLGGCVDLFGPELPDGAVALDPLPAEYAGWWALTETCTGVRGEMADVGFYVLPGSETIAGSRGAIGLYQEGRHRIVLTETHLRNGHLVRHEMIHALLRGGGHPRSLFQERCGGVVSCSGPCREEGGTRPTWRLDLPVAEEEELQVSVALLPSTVSLSTATQGCVSIAVSLTNLSGEARTADIRSGRAFGFALEGWGEGGGGRGSPVLGERLISLPDSQPWTWVEDCPAVFAGALAPGTYAVRGLLDGLFSEPATLTVIP